MGARDLRRHHDPQMIYSHANPGHAWSVSGALPSRRETIPPNERTKLAGLTIAHAEGKRLATVHTVTAVFRGQLESASSKLTSVALSRCLWVSGVSPRRTERAVECRGQGKRAVAEEADGSDVGWMVREGVWPDLVLRNSVSTGGCRWGDREREKVTIVRQRGLMFELIKSGGFIASGFARTSGGFQVAAGKLPVLPAFDLPVSLWLGVVQHERRLTLPEHRGQREQHQGSASPDQVASSLTRAVGGMQEGGVVGWKRGVGDKVRAGAPGREEKREDVEDEEEKEAAVATGCRRYGKVLRRHGCKVPCVRRSD
ncbi:hypothetical protein BD413DRAFT_495079 [Trametes elegans]|nr:hypothetical protein BD413DRAFT_495079 [Trametes elegans]